MKRFPDQPAHPERLCWGCDRYCASNDMRCGNGSVRTPHPVELFGAGWAGELQDTALPKSKPALISGRKFKQKTPNIEWQ